MGRPPRIPWDELRECFVQGEEVEEKGRDLRRWPTTGDLARRYGVDPATVSRAAHRERPEGTWIQQRDTFKAELQSRGDERVARALGDRASAFRVATFGLAHRVLVTVNRNLQAEEPSARELHYLVQAASRAQQIGLTALGPLAEDDAPKAPDPKPERPWWDPESLFPGG